MITLTDMFCGAGGSSTGALEVPGIEVRTAMNHWDRAIETHNTNHPDADHVQADISQTDPRYVRPSDILWASPECTNHSVAKGSPRAAQQEALFSDGLPAEAAERSRATMWDVPRFAEHHDYKVIITENVVDAARWVMWDAWLHAMDCLGYRHQVVYLNSMHAQAYGMPAPQSRDRMYVVFWKKGNPAPDFDRLRPWAECDTCGPVQAVQVFKKPHQPWGRYRSQYVWRCPSASCRNSVVEPGWVPAASAIDWSIRGTRIGDRPRPLAEKTMRRIQAGLTKYAGHRMGAGRPPLIVNNLSGNDAGRTATALDPLRTLVAGGLHESLLVPGGGHDAHQHMHAFVMRNNSSKGAGAEMVTPTDEPYRTFTTKGHQSLITPAARSSMITTMRGTTPGQLAASSRPADEPIGTLTAGGTHHGLTEFTSTDVMDAEFRMLQPHEITWGMSFPRDYIMLGTKSEQVKLAGNAVTPPAARDLIAIAAATLN